MEENEEETTKKGAFLWILLQDKRCREYRYVKRYNWRRRRRRYYTSASEDERERKQATPSNLLLYSPNSLTKVGCTLFLTFFAGGTSPAPSPSPSRFDDDVEA